MGLKGGAFVSQKLFAVLLCSSWCKAQRSTVSVCMDEEHLAILSQYAPNTPEYEMLLLKFQRDIRDNLVRDLGIQPQDVSVNLPPDCVPELPPPPPPAVSRPNMPSPPPPPPTAPQSIQHSMAIDFSPEYAAQLCDEHSDEHNKMMRQFQEQTAARLSTCGRRGTIGSNYVDNDCNGCAPGTCLDADAITIDSTMLGCEGSAGQTVEHEMEVTVSDEWARALCGGEGTPGYDETKLQIQTAVAHHLGIADPSQVEVAQLRSSLDCDTSDQSRFNDNRNIGNSVYLDITDQYAHQLCDTNSVAFLQFKRAFQMQVAASINDACTPDPATGRTCPRQGEQGYITPEQIQVDDQSILENAHCTEMAANGMHTAPPATSGSNGPSDADVDGAAAGAKEDSSAFDLAVIVLVVACVGMGYRQKTRPPKAKYQAVSADEEIPLSDYSIDSPSDSDRDRRDNPSFAGQFGAARIGSGKRR